MVKFNTLKFETPLTQTDLTGSQEFELEGFHCIRLAYALGLRWGRVTVVLGLLTTYNSAQHLGSH